MSNVDVDEARAHLTDIEQSIQRAGVYLDSLKSMFNQTKHYELRDLLLDMERDVLSVERLMAEIRDKHLGS